MTNYWTGNEWLTTDWRDETDIFTETRDGHRAVRTEIWVVITGKLGSIIFFLNDVLMSV